MKALFKLSDRVQLKLLKGLAERLEWEMHNQELSLAAITINQIESLSSRIKNDIINLRSNKHIDKISE